MLKEALMFLKPIGLCNIIITCEKENPASSSVIIKNGGILEEEFYSEKYKGVIQRYHIHTK